MPQEKYEIITGIIVVTFILLLAGFFIVALVAFNNRRKKKHIDEKKKMQDDFQREILRTQLEIQEQTLKNISQEIHDNIGQVLSLAKLNLATADLSRPDKLQSKIDDSKNLVAKAIQDLRDLSKSLNTDYVIQMGLARSIEYEMEMIKKTDLFEVHFEIDGSVFKMEQQQELILFRIMQETLNNILKHSKASRIHIFLGYASEHFKMRIQDNGQGFEINSLDPDLGNLRSLGIRNMQNRAALIHANFKITSNPGKGTEVNLLLPINPALYA